MASGQHLPFKADYSNGQQWGDFVDLLVRHT